MAMHRSLELMEQQRLVHRRRASSAEAARQAETSAHPLLTLQRQVGNAQVARMLALRQETPAEEEEELVQAKHDPAIAQRQGAPEEEEEELIQTSRDATAGAAEVGLEGGPVSDELVGRISSQRGGGAALDDGTRVAMEGAFGTSFADVRAHTGAEADALNRSISAQAFTTGRDIFFSGNASPADSRLLAHELTHVVQQRGMDASGPMTVSPAGDSHEQEAEGAASAVTASLAAGTTQRLPETEADV